MCIATELEAGCWRAIWANWEVQIEGSAAGWSATVSHRTIRVQGTTMRESGFDSPLAAAQWAASQLKARGCDALVLSDSGGPPKTLVDMLQFERAEPVREG